MIGNVKERKLQTRDEEKSDNVRRLSRIDPSNVRVVALVVKRSGQVQQYDCYDPDGTSAGMGNIINLREGEIWLRMIDWARTRSRSEVRLQWSTTGLVAEEVGRLSVFRWPLGTPVRVFSETN